MSHAALQTTIDEAWEARDSVSSETKGEVRDAVNEALNLMDAGDVRVAEKIGGNWQVNQWLKKSCSAVLSSQRYDNHRRWSGCQHDMVG